MYFLADIKPVFSRVCSYMFLTSRLACGFVVHLSGLDICPVRGCVWWGWGCGGGGGGVDNPCLLSHWVILFIKKVYSIAPRGVNKSSPRFFFFFFFFFFLKFPIL